MIDIERLLVFIALGESLEASGFSLDDIKLMIEQPEETFQSLQHIRHANVATVQYKSVRRLETITDESLLTMSVVDLLTNENVTALPRPESDYSRNDRLRGEEFLRPANRNRVYGAGRNAVAQYLMQADIKTVGELMSYSARDLYRDVPKIGLFAVNAIAQALEFYGLTLKGHIAGAGRY